MILIRLRKLQIKRTLRLSSHGIWIHEPSKISWGYLSMLRYRKGVLYYKKDAVQMWREVPEDQHAKRWEQRAKELEAYVVSITDKYKAVAAELEEVSEQLKISNNMLRLSAKDNLAKDVIIKSLTNKDVKNEMDFNTICSN
uniref:Uncharacterized protein n=1 Tax=uncultured marine virus TaxID=186617 RepID=A0A0F7L403_9VIRU|nr:hypothetical protein [uncultured marine virus]